MTVRFTARQRDGLTVGRRYISRVVKGSFFLNYSCLRHRHIRLSPRGCLRRCHHHDLVIITWLSLPSPQKQPAPEYPPSLSFTSI